MNDLYNFDLPKALIAQEPAHPRDSARLLVYRLSDGEIVDSIFSEIDTFLPSDTTLVLNNSKVEQCRWLFDRGKTEIFVIEKLDTNTVRGFVRPGKKFRNDSEIQLTDWLQVRTTNIDNEGIRTLKLNNPHDDARLKAFEHVPLPPYIEQNDSLSKEYQTVYAKPEGSLAAPTAGLHFTERLLEDIKQKHAVAELTLHVGLGTFAKLTEENIRTGRLHEEWASINEETALLLNDAAHRTAVGTTTVRTLESFVDTSGLFTPVTAETDIFIRPGYAFRAVDAMVTNFHLPSTSLLMLVAAFIADKRHLDEAAAAGELQRIYQHAISNSYRFYSFGDAMLLV